MPFKFTLRPDAVVVVAGSCSLRGVQLIPGPSRCAVGVLQVSYRVVLGGLRQEKQWEAAVKLLAEMETRGVGPDERSVAMGMNACVAARETQRAIDLFEGMRDAGEVSSVPFGRFFDRSGVS